MRRPCVGCGTLITNGSRCTTCKPARQRNGWRWTQRRREVLDRDGHACTTCGATQQLTIEHIVAIRHGGTDDLTNLATRCPQHRLDINQYC